MLNNNPAIYVKGMHFPTKNAHLLNY